MRSLIESLSDHAIGVVRGINASTITVLVDSFAPQVTAMNTGTPMGFPRINGYLLMPNELGATVGIITSVQVEQLPYPKKKGNQDFGLIDLPFSARVIKLTPIGNLRSSAHGTSADVDSKMRRGVDVFPSVGDPVHLPGPEQLQAIVEGASKGESGRILLGHCPTAHQAPVYVDPDKVFGRHLAVLGNTGAGKSCSVAGIIRWSLESANNELIRLDEQPPESGIPKTPNARFIVLDPNGEYAQAFNDLGMRVFRVESKKPSEQLKIPAWLWNGVEWAAFTNASPGVQRPILFDALKLLRSELGPPDEFKTRVRRRVHSNRKEIKVSINSGDYKPRGKREEVASLLISMHKDFLDLTEDSRCTDITLKDHLNGIADKARIIEESNRGRENQDQPGTYWHNPFSESDLEKLVELLQDAGDYVGLEEMVGLIDEDTPRIFSINDLSDYVNALAAASPSRDISRWVDTLTLRIRRLLLNGRLRSVIQPDRSDSLTLEEWLTDHLGADHVTKKTPIVVVDLSLVPSDVTHIIVSVLARIIFEALQRYRRETSKELPTTLVLEEAHSFIHKHLAGESSHPAARECVKVFERIAREGRKFGLGLVLASQRPSEISPTVLSQCNTFLLHRLVNDRDLDLVKRMVPDGLGSLLQELPNLPTRRAILLGWATSAPSLVEMQEIPLEHRPHSPDPAFWNVWIGKEQREIVWEKIVRIWQKRDFEPSLDIEKNEPTVK
ncbi:MAG: DUF87 domain-containing protein [Bacteroidota bacterium]|nr:DUF87 domain-containing protein [Bacteroidota bacterium]